MVKTAIDVEVHSGVTPTPGVMAVEAFEGYDSNEQTAFVPWRIGSERHLGITRGSAMTVNDVPPPYSEINR